MKQLVGRRMLLGAALGSALGLSPAIAWAQQQPVKIGAVFSLSVSFGQQSKRGMDLAVKQINAAGGILGGRPVELIAYDDQGRPDEAASATERLISRDKVSVLIGPNLSTAAISAMNVAKRYDKLLILHVPKVVQLRDQGGSKFFFLNSTVAMDAAGFHRYAADVLKPQTVVVMSEMSDYGESVVKQVEGDWSKPGSPKILSVERFDPKETDFTALLTKIRGLRPDAVYVGVANLETFATALRQFAEVGLKARILPGPGAVSAQLVKLAGGSADGLIFGDFYSNMQPGDQNAKFVSDFAKEYGYRPDKLELTGYEAVTIAAAGMDLAKTDSDPDAIAKAIAGRVWDTPRGTWSFEKLGASYQAPANSLLLTIKAGQMVPFTP
jgi:branched-chain amino acid transport system substrate-binding protein